MKGLYNLILANNFRFSYFVRSNGFKNVRNVIQMALKWLFFAPKLQKSPNGPVLPWFLAAVTRIVASFCSACLNETFLQTKNID